MASAGLVLCCASLAMGTLQGAPEATERPPNVLFVVVDDLNDWIGPLGGNRQARTPHLDRLAERGVVFTNAHCAAPDCNPSRTAVLTGVYPHRSGITNNTQPFREAMPDAVTLPQHFRRHGYTALGAGKVFHNRFPDPDSWDAYYPRPAENRKPRMQPANHIEGADTFDWGPLDRAEGKMSDDKVASWVIDQLAQQHERPFFLACGFFRTHLPWYVPRSYFQDFPLGEVELPEAPADDLDDVPAAARQFAEGEERHALVLEHEQWRQAVRSYLAATAFVDARIGSVLDALDESPHAANTIVVVWGDHGYHLGEKGRWGKYTLWEEATRVPLIVAGPGIDGGGRAGAAVSLLDVYPTLIELCGLAPRLELEGESLVPLLADPSAPRERPALITNGSGNHAVRSTRWRYVRFADGTEELYDHEADPDEWRNLAGEPERASVKERLSRWLP